MRLVRRLLLLLLVVVACDPERRTARIHGFDVLAPADTEVALVANVEADDLLHLHPDLHGVPVVFSLAGKEIGKATTGRDGLASCAWKPPGHGVHEIAVEVAAGARYRAGTRLRAFVRDKERLLLVVDLDGTVCAGSSLDVLRKAPADLPVVEGAPEALTRLAARFDLVYLTARDDSLIGRSRDWLDLKGFPQGPLLVRDLSLHTLSAKRYKTKRLQELAKVWRLGAGVGDRDEDAEAYKSVGMRSFLVPAQSWKEIAEALSAPPAPAGAPQGRDGR